MKGHDMARNYNQTAIEEAAYRIYDLIPEYLPNSFEGLPEPWDEAGDDYRYHCRKLAAAALNIEWNEDYSS